MERLRNREEELMNWMVNIISGHESWKAHAAMIMVQFFNGGCHVIMRVALNKGMNKVVFCAYRDAIAFCILAPIAYFAER